MTNILYILWDGKIGGAASNIADFVKKMNSKKYHVTICLINESGPTINAISFSAINIVEIKAKSGVDIFAFFRFIKFLRFNHFDIIHNNTRTYFSHLALIIFANKIPLIYHEHGDLDTKGDEKRSGFAYRLFSRFYKKYITVSDDTIKSIRQVGVPLNKITNIGNPIDYIYFSNVLSKNSAKQKLGFSSYELLVGTAARFAPEKDLALFLSTAKEICKKVPEVHFVLAGGGYEETYLRNLTKDLNINNNVHFIGIQIEMVNVYRALDIYLFTSFRESFGRSILECLSSGTPLVAVLPEYGGSREIIQRAPGVSYIHNRNIYDLAKLTIDLLKNPDERILRGELGRKWILEETEFHIENWINRLEEVYCQVLAKK